MNLPLRLRSFCPPLKGVRQLLSPVQSESRQTISETASKSWNRTAVRCLAGYTANERPISFLVDEQEIEVRTILESRRREPPEIMTLL